jgi:hypothetical protein
LLWLLSSHSFLSDGSRKLCFLTVLSCFSVSLVSHFKFFDFLVGYQEHAQEKHKKNLNKFLGFLLSWSWVICLVAEKMLGTETLFWFVVFFFTLEIKRQKNNKKVLGLS